MATQRKSLLNRILKWFAIGIGVLVALACLSAAYLHWFSPIDRAWVISTLSKRYEANIELDSFKSSLLPRIDVEGAGLVLRRKDQPSAPPLASIQKFSLSAHWLSLLMHPRHIGRVKFEGLVLNIPSRKPEEGGTRKPKKAKHVSAPFILEDLNADGTVLNIFSSKADKPPHTFNIQKLRMESGGNGQPMLFDATLTNPVPVGLIHSTGQFGPWNPDDPSLTPVSGDYTFSHADLSTIHGLAGILSSEGRYEGVLSQIEVHGRTDTPDFALGITGNPIHLKTEFTAVVDGINGDTFLRPVTAQLGTSTIVAKGGIARTNGVPGRTILLNATVKPARLEDVLGLAVKSARPPMTGSVEIETSIDIHPGNDDVAKRLKLDGQFTIRSARFTNADAEQKISGLSRLGQGKREDKQIQNVPLDMQGQFVMGNGLVNFSKLSVSVPGADVRLQGNFGLISQKLDFEGELRLQAKVSQMTSGVKSILLKAVDPLFSRDGAGAVLPIKITGTKNSPSFGIEFGKIFKR